MKLLTIFTPSYNRKHTICRTFKSLLRQTCKDFNWLIIDDGSSDGTKEWVESLEHGRWVKNYAYDWMGRKTSSNCDNAHFVVDVPTPDGNSLHIDYIRKPNGGLYTGYNVAYDFIQTELCVCIDSDDFAPDDAVEKISKRWLERNKNKKYCGIVGLDFNYVGKRPIGGFFTVGVNEGYYTDVKRDGDTKEVMRVDLMKTVAPQVGFEGEKDFNPFYMISQIVDKYPILVENSNLCWVEYQIGTDSMSQAIFKQFIRSPKSYARYRLMQMQMTKGVSFIRRFSLAAHYVSACIFSKDGDWLRNSNHKIMTILAVPIGIVYNVFIRYKAKK